MARPRLPPPRATATEKILARSVGFAAAFENGGRGRGRARPLSLPPSFPSAPRPPPSMSSITRGRTSGLSNFDRGKVRQKVDSVMMMMTTTTMTMTNEVSGDHRRSNVMEGRNGERKAEGRKEGARFIIITSLRIRLRTKGTDRPTDRPSRRGRRREGSAAERERKGRGIGRRARGLAVCRNEEKATGEGEAEAEGEGEGADEPRARTSRSQMNKPCC